MMVMIVIIVMIMIMVMMIMMILVIIAIMIKKFLLFDRSFFLSYAFPVLHKGNLHIRIWKRLDDDDDDGNENDNNDDVDNCDDNDLGFLCKIQRSVTLVIFGFFYLYFLTEDVKNCMV